MGVQVLKRQKPRLIIDEKWPSPFGPTMSLGAFRLRSGSRGGLRQRIADNF
jgi:hypothetical protein